MGLGRLGKLSGSVTNHKEPQQQRHWQRCSLLVLSSTSLGLHQSRFLLYLINDFSPFVPLSSGINYLRKLPRPLSDLKTSFLGCCHIWGHQVPALIGVLCRRGLWDCEAFQG